MENYQQKAISRISENDRVLIDILLSFSPRYEFDDHLEYITETLDEFKHWQAEYKESKNSSSTEQIIFEDLINRAKAISELLVFSCNNEEINRSSLTLAAEIINKQLIRVKVNCHHLRFYRWMVEEDVIEALINRAKAISELLLFSFYNYDSGLLELAEVAESLDQILAQLQVYLSQRSNSGE